MGNNCCNFEDEEDLLGNSSEIYSNVTSTVIDAPRISTEDNRNRNRIIKQPNDRLLERCRSYTEYKNIIDSPPSRYRSIEENTSFRERNSFKSPNVIAHIDQNEKYRDGNSMKPLNIVASRTHTERNTNYKVRNETPEENINNREINIVDASSQFRAMIEQATIVWKNVSVQAKESTNIISKPDYSQSRLVEDLPNNNTVDTLQIGEQVYVNNILHRLLNVNYVQSNRSVLDRRNLYELEKLDYNSQEYRQLEALFYKTNKRFFKIHSIEKVHNSYLAMQYELKKIELTKRNIQFEERKMYHGTKKCNIDSICQKNFDWRLTGTSRGCKFGEGVSFSPIAYYATHYGDTTYNKVMIVAHVIVGDCCEGYRNMLIPHLGFDTSVNKKKEVYVKYDDNSFYPSYLIHYGGIDEKAANKKSRNDEQFLEYTFTTPYFGMFYNVL